MDRRKFLSLGGGLAVAATVAPTTSASAAFRTKPCDPTSPTSATMLAGTGPRWPGHKPGRVYLGLSSPDLRASLALTGPVGAHRSFFEWNDPAEDSTIKADHAARRLPWVSFKPPTGPNFDWTLIGVGAFDSDIKARARRYAAYGKPLVSTFHHEPTNDSGIGAAWASAYVRHYDVMKQEAGLANVAFVPIIGDWDFNPRNSNGHPEYYLTPDVLSRMPFLGVDLYQTGSKEGFSQRLGRILSWLQNHGVSNPMVGVGETGCCLAESAHPDAWFTANWNWAVNNTDKIGVVSYFDSRANSQAGHDWRLQETAAKTRAFKAALATATACRL